MRLFCVGNKGFEKNLSRKWLSYEKWPNFEYFQVWRRSWDEHDIEMRTKFNMYEEEVLTTLLYLSETWTTISPYSKLLEPFWTIKSHKCECISLNCAIFFPFFLISIFIMYCFFFFLDSIWFFFSFFSPIYRRLTAKRNDIIKNRFPQNRFIYRLYWFVSLMCFT